MPKNIDLRLADCIDTPEPVASDDGKALLYDASSGSYTHTTIPLLDTENTWTQDQSFSQDISVGSQIFVGDYDVMVLNGTNVNSHIAINSDLRAILEVHSHSATAGNGSIYYGARSRGSLASPTIVQSGDSIRIDAAVGYDGSDYEYVGYTEWTVGGTPGNNDMPGQWALYVTADGAISPTVNIRAGATTIGFLGAAPSAALSDPDLGTLATTFGLATGTPTFDASNLTNTAAIDGRLIAHTVYTSGSAATHSWNASAASAIIELIGGGGGGGGVSGNTSNSAAASGGGSGAYLRKHITDLSAGNATYTVGGGGAGGTAGANNGTNGSDTTFVQGATTYTAGGGTGGTAMAFGTAAAIAAGVAGGTATNGDLNVSGGYSGTGLRASSSVALSGQGGAGYFGSGPAGVVNSAGTTATTKGAGGGGAGTNSNNNRPGGDGAAGVIIVWELS